MKLKDLVSIISLLIGCSGLTFGLYQYYVAQRWKRSEFAAKLLEDFYNDQEILFCRQVLDYESRKVPIPDKYKNLQNESWFNHEKYKLILSMKFEDWNQCDDPDILIYRDCFDRMFLHLESLNHYLMIGLFSKKDITKIYYWLKEISHPRFIDDKGLFINFLVSYSYFGVLNLMKVFSIDYEENISSALVVPDKSQLDSTKIKYLDENSSTK